MSKALPKALQRLINNLKKLPGIGEKSATRLALHILRWPESRAQELAASIGELHQKIGICSHCYTFSEQDPCPICSDPSRDSRSICVVEDPDALLAVEQSGVFKGCYHVLHGALSPMDGIGPEELKLKELLERIKKQSVKEVILATSSTVAGEATAAYIAKLLENTPIKLTRIACGIPMGMDLKYADKMTLQRALEARREL